MDDPSSRHQFGISAGPHPLFRAATQSLVLREIIGHKAALTIDMKLTIAFLSIVLTLGFGACSTAKIATKEVNLVACCASNEPDKTVLLQDSFEPGGRVVRLAH